MSEQWRDVPGWDGYRVSNMGHIMGPSGRLLKGQSAGSRGEYRAISRWVGPRRRQTLTFHRAVALAFLGNPPSAAHEVAHNDGDPRNNAPSNLRWATHADNNADRERHGTDVHGEKSATALLTNDQARAIRARALGGERGIDLAVEFGVSKHIVSLIKLGRTYKDA